MPTHELEPKIRLPHEGREKSFDINASIYMMRYDFDNFGQILPETRSRIYDEELTYVAEGINLPLETEFEIQEVDGDLKYFKNGEWQSYISMLETGLEVARSEAEEDSRKKFLLEWAQRDLEIGQKFNEIEPNESLEWYSSYRYEEEAKYGEKLLEDVGLQPKRNMGFLYRFYRDKDGRRFLQSRSVDNSDEEAFCAAMASTIYDQSADMETMLSAYDETLSRKYGGEYKAGRLAGGEVEQNAWDIIHQNKNLVGWYFDELEKIAESDIHGKDLERAKKRKTLEFWSTVKTRIDKEAELDRTTYSAMDSVAETSSIQAEANASYQCMQEKGEALIGCGGGIELTDFSLSDARDLIFGAVSRLSAGSDQYGSLTFKCEKGHLNNRPHGKLIDCCQTCGVSVSC